MPFRLLIDFNALELLDRLPVRQRRAVFEHLRKIQNYPGYYSDYLSQEADGKRLDVSAFGNFHIFYWTDTADRHIKILRIEEK